MNIEIPANPREFCIFVLEGGEEGWHNFASPVRAFAYVKILQRYNIDFFIDIKRERQP